ncbi:ankyrin repeat-containing domain protein [Lasiosphaeria miniovina]|uniref:Ankyrin repeat-containing domain protein n=1 Tax=Lasiosphaeria miniovina TaxID=1954250 RepID=A0AA40AU28_9PEZI|nr:ankyrin repeat-containing domain protein [Lasiosphaeria miniovina]KAK0721934.1 ankyrin repeat-containing domain protein [Lasiosphaeria miniovina]
MTVKSQIQAVDGQIRESDQSVKSLMQSVDSKIDCVSDRVGALSVALAQKDTADPTSSPAQSSNDTDRTTRAGRAEEMNLREADRLLVEARRSMMLGPISPNRLGPSCSSTCRCRCHSRRRNLNPTPEWVKSALGNIDIHQSSGGAFPFSNHGCDNRDCLRQSSQTVGLGVRYRFPSWVASREFQFKVDFGTQDRQHGPSVSIRVPVIVLSDHELWSAVRTGDVKTIADHLKQGTWSIHSVDENGASLLFVALLSRQLQLAMQLIHWGAVLDSKSTCLARDILRYQYDLDKGGKLSNLAILQNIASAGQDDDGDDDEQMVIHETHLAAKGLFDMGPELENDPESINSRDSNGKAPLHWACNGGNAGVVKLLVREGADVNVADFSGQTPLMTAASHGAVPCARALLFEEGGRRRRTCCQVDRLDTQGRTALHYAAASSFAGGGAHAVMRLLLDCGADPRRCNLGGETALHELASSYTAALPSTELLRRVEILLNAGADLEAADKWAYTPALQAATEDNHTALGVFLGLGARADVVDMDKMGMLHFAALFGGTDTIQQLRDAELVGVDVEAPNYQGDTPSALFIWRRRARLWGCETWVRVPTTGDAELFAALLYEVQKRNGDQWVGRG